MTILIIGAAGFIGSHLSQSLCAGGSTVHGLDKLTSRANPRTVTELTALPNFTLHRQDMADRAALEALLAATQPTTIVNLATEYADSVHSTPPYLATNILGTQQLLQATLTYWQKLPEERQQEFRLLHVSTAQVYGALGLQGRFAPTAPHAPPTPYAASRAAAENLVAAWHNYHGLPTLTAICGDCFGPAQAPEQLIPAMLLKAVHGEIMPLYGAGDHIRSWLYSTDLVSGLITIMAKGKPGQRYHLGGEEELSSLALMHRLCAVLDLTEPDSPYCPHRGFIQFAAEPPGHVFRNVLDCSATAALGWQPQTSLEEGLRETVAWYLAHPDWWQDATIATNAHRIGLGPARPAEKS